jgi:hypothetical protein
MQECDGGLSRSMKRWPLRIPAARRGSFSDNLSRKQQRQRELFHEEADCNDQLYL